MAAQSADQCQEPAASPPARLTAADYDECLDFIDLVFSAHGGEHVKGGGFATLLPQLYTPEKMHWNFGIRKAGRLVSVVGIFPRTWRVMGETLQIEGIGGVATHARLGRGSGHMRELMRHCVETMRASGCHIAMLAGQRQRYAYYGFEKAGSTYSFSVSAKNVAHRANFGLAEAGRQPMLRFEALPTGRDASDSALLKRAEAFHAAPAAECRVERGSEFALFLQTWRNRGWAAIDEATGDMIGYLVANGSGSEISELHGASVEAEVAIICAWASSRPTQEDGVIVLLPAWRAEGPLGRAISAFSEGASLLEAEYNFLIFKWAEILAPLLRLRAATTGAPLATGTVHLIIDGYGTVRLTVGASKQEGSAQECTCERCETEVAQAVKVSAAQATRLLFGPMRPSATMVLEPEVAALLTSWCPLPLFWCKQDGM